MYESIPRTATDVLEYVKELTLRNVPDTVSQSQSRTGKSHASRRRRTAYILQATAAANEKDAGDELDVTAEDEVVEDEGESSGTRQADAIRKRRWSLSASSSASHGEESTETQTRSTASRGRKQVLLRLLSKMLD